MKIILTLLMCSLSTGECMPPYQWPVHFESTYECLTFGYEESRRKMKEIGPKEGNQYGIFIRFTCTPAPSV